MQIKEWDKDAFDSFHQAYQAAHQAGVVEFTWRNRQFYTAYARYLVEFLTPHFYGGHPTTEGGEH